jgi:hypothetical protein
MPTFYPLRSEVSSTAYPLHRGERLEKDGDGYVLYSMYKNPLPDDTEVSVDFTLADLVIGESLVAGHTTRGAWECGIYLGYGDTPGRYLNFTGSQYRSLLWGNLVLLRGSVANEQRKSYAARQKYLDKVAKKLEEKKAAGENTECCGTPEVSDDEDCYHGSYGMPLQRTDSGTSYGFTGYPDVEFWARSGIVADAYVPAETYNGHKNLTQEFYIDGIQKLREMNHDDISPALQAAINKQAGHYTKMLEELSV